MPNFATRQMCGRSFSVAFGVHLHSLALASCLGRRHRRNWDKDGIYERANPTREVCTLFGFFTLSR